MLIQPESDLAICPPPHSVAAPRESETTAQLQSGRGGSAVPFHGWLRSAWARSRRSLLAWLAVAFVIAMFWSMTGGFVFRVGIAVGIALNVMVWTGVYWYWRDRRSWDTIHREDEE